MIAVIATSLMVITYSFLFFHYRKSFMAKWAAAWIVHGIRLVFFEGSFVDQSSQLLSVTYLILSMLYSLFLVAGTLEFTSERFSRKWILYGTICLLLSIAGFLLHLPLYIYTVSMCFFIAVIYISTGLSIRNKVSISGLGQPMTSYAFILLGLHTADLPFLYHIPGIIVWGYSLDGILRFIVAIGILFMYFEKTKEQLEEENCYRMLAETATDIVYRYRLSEPACIEYFSPAMERITGYEPSNYKTVLHMLRIIHPDDRIKFKALIRNFLKKIEVIRLRIVDSNGAIIWMEHIYSLVYDGNDKAVSVNGIVRDITNRVLLEQDLARLDRLNIAGQMAANFAHEIRNPITTIRGYLQLIGSKKEFSNYAEQLALLLDELDRTNSIITEYLSLNKNKTVKMKRRDLNKIIQLIFPMIQSDAVCSGIVVKLSLSNIPDLYIDENEIKQLIFNLTRNAIEAMPTGGVLEIRTYCSEDETFLAIKDQGAGIPQSILADIGKPFVTTKDTGTGIGLAICYRIMDRHSAKLEIDTGKFGTTMRVKFIQ